MDIRNLLDNRINNLVHKINVLLLSLIIAFAPVYSFAASSLGGWSSTGVTASRGVATINATTEAIINGASRTVKSFAKVTPAASGLARGIGRFGAVAAVTTAIDALLGGVDWVLDPANNRVKYTDPSTTDPSSFQYIYQTRAKGTFHTTTNAAANATCKEMGWGAATSFSKFASQSYSPFESWTAKCSTGNTYQFYLVANPNYDPNAKPEEKYLPYDAVGARIASDAAAGDPAANDFVRDVVAADVADAEQGKPLAYPNVIPQLDANQAVEEKEADNDITKDDPANPDAPTEKFKLPGFCSWAAFICNAMNISNKNSGTVATESTKIRTAAETTAIDTAEIKNDVKAGNTQAHSDAEKQLAETTKAATAARELTDFAKQEPTTQEENFNVDKSDLTLPTLDQNRVQFGNQCPAPLTGSYTMFGRSFSINYPWDAACEVAAMFKPAVVGCSTIAAIYIMLGMNRIKED